jgi:hypothetical protein
VREAVLLSLVPMLVTCAIACRWLWRSTHPAAALRLLLFALSRNMSINLVAALESSWAASREA